MDQLRKLIAGFSLRQRITILAVAAAVVAGITGFVHWNHERDFKPIYGSLSAEDSSAVLAKLREAGVEYRVSPDSGTVLVPSKRIPELRLQMASAGIPKSGRIGFELFDKANFGTTDFEEQVNYHRAIEGELERSVMAMSGVEQARVHITFPKESVFVESRQPAKASVMVKLKAGARMTTQNAAAVQQLLASAVETLTPDSVSVMDMQGNLLLRPKKPGDGTEPNDELIAYKEKLEKETLAKITSVLDPLLGSEKYRASVDLDCDLTSGEQSEETFDPNKSVLTTSQRTEEGSMSQTTGGVPGTASNLPRPSPAPVPRTGGVARRTESMAYQTSRLVRRLRMPQGIVKRMSVSVLVDQNLRWQLEGKGANAHYRKVIEPLSADQMKIIHNVVSTAAGFDQPRGDQITVETLPFQATLNAEPPAIPGVAPHPVSDTRKFPPLVLAGAGLGALLLLGGVGVLFWQKRRKAKAQAAAMAAQLEAAEAAKQDNVVADQVQLANLAESLASAERTATAVEAADALPEPYRLPPMLTTKTEVLTKQVAEQARKDPSALAHVIRAWLNEK